MGPAYLHNRLGLLVRYAWHVHPSCPPGPAVRPKSATIELGCKRHLGPPRRGLVVAKLPLSCGRSATMCPPGYTPTDTCQYSEHRQCVPEGLMSLVVTAMIGADHESLGTSSWANCARGLLNLSSDQVTKSSCVLLQRLRAPCVVVLGGRSTCVCVL